MKLMQYRPDHEQADEDEPEVVCISPAWIAEGVCVEIGLREDGLCWKFDLDWSSEFIQQMRVAYSDTSCPTGAPVPVGCAA
jgi:hypothetical protein